MRRLRLPNGPLARRPRTEVSGVRTEMRIVFRPGGGKFNRAEWRATTVIGHPPMQVRVFQSGRSEDANIGGSLRAKILVLLLESRND